MLYLLDLRYTKIGIVLNFELTEDSDLIMLRITHHNIENNNNISFTIKCRLIYPDIIQQKFLDDKKDELSCSRKNHFYSCIHF